MEAKNSITSKNNGFEGQFKNLNNDEMISLKGGVQVLPPSPPTGGVDFPIPLNPSMIPHLPTL